MKHKIKNLLKDIAKFIIILTVLTNAISFYKSQSLNSNNLTKTSFITLDSKKYTINKQKPLIIHFWATWCPTCKMEAKNIELLSKYYQVITIAVKSNKNDIDKYLLENNLNMIVINDKNAKLAKEFNVMAYPTTFIYNSNQKLVFSEVGYTSTIGFFLRMLSI